ncbi:hypothetical protein HD806DRAFT_512632, partial [Xylariaceae sp. AK1471]
TITSTEPKPRRRMRPTHSRGVVSTCSSHHGFFPRGFTGVSTGGRVSYYGMGGGNHQSE